MKYILQLVALMIASAVVLPAAVMAQSDIGAHVDHNKMRLTDFDDLFFHNSARAGLNVISLCLAGKRPAQAKETLSLGFMSRQQTRSLDRFFDRFLYDSSCNLTGHVESDMEFVPIIGGLAEYFLIEKYTSGDIDTLAQMDPLKWQAGSLTPRNGNESFGQCVVQADSAAAYKLANTIPDTRSEANAFEALLPVLGPCLADGQEVAFDKNSLRAMLAYSLYRVVSHHQKMLEAAR